MNMKEALSKTDGFFRVPAEIAKQFPAGAGAFRVTGDCMEGAGIYDGDIIIVDLARRPRSGDACICIVHGKPLLKRYVSTLGKGCYAVGTCYDFGGKAFQVLPDGSCRMNAGLIASEIGGVVLASFSLEGSPRWIKDYRSFPFELPPVRQSEGANCEIVFA